MDYTKTLKLNNINMRLKIGNILFVIIGASYLPPIAGNTFKNHAHNSYELHFVKSGKGVLFLDDKQYNLTEGIHYLTGPGVYHTQISDSKDPMCEYSLNFSFSIVDNAPNFDVQMPLEENSILQDILNKTSSWIGQDPYNTWAIIDEIIHEFEEKKIGYFSYVQSLASKVILNSIRNYGSHKNADYAIADNANDFRLKIIDEFFRIYTNDQNIKNLSQKLNISVRHTERIIKELYGMGFKEKLIESRLSIAKFYLLNSADSIDVISEKSNFSSPSYFSTLFKKKYGISPGEFRKSNAQI